MLVLLGPPFSGTEDDYARLSAATGLLAYDLKTRIKPGAWGVVRALANVELATELATALRAQGFRVSVVDPAVAADTQRPFAVLRGLELRETDMVLQLSERAIPIAYRALLTIVRGEVQIGSRQRSRTTSPTFRVPTNADIEVFRETHSSSELDAYAAADIHFQTVLWGARIDVRSFDFSVLGRGATGTAQDLDRLVDLIAERAGLRVDRASRVSSVASFGAGGQGRSTSPVPGHAVPPSRRELPDRFDAYSRLVAEAERQAARLGRTTTRPPSMP